MTSTVFSNDPDRPRKFAGLLLILNCAEDRLQLCLARDGDLLAHQDWVVPGRAMRHLAPALDQILTSLKLKIFDLEGVACVRGPGGFTGLRLCLATAYGLAFGANLPLAGLDYLPLLASGPALLLQGRLAVLTHARQCLVHVQVFTVPNLVPVCPPQVMSMDAPSLLTGMAETSLFVLGSGVRRNMSLMTANLSHARILDPVWDHPRPEQLIEAALAAHFSLDPIDPLYLRPSDAEENLEAIAARRGLNPQEARHRLSAGLETTHDRT
ncbi:MAG TPA: tRNA (adenosine(37)-N6)-threonylcarbamoyltransferase complex dimerization subunit type 1 TsaB [Desulfonatronum sp.]|nr:tRNA (adenosine(37)-N6)-threonylcarbamoyltransferase complex dimerization subunit type 1 TsaB [Desulfonatronum sp.]